MKTVPLLALLMTLAAAPHALGQKSVYVNPGIKVGYTFGGSGGFTFGLELSVTQYQSRGLILGGVIDYDYTPASGMHKTHLGAEGSVWGLGVDVGPTWVSRKGVSGLGATFTPFVGLVAYPYYSFTVAEGMENIHEAGAYLKPAIHVYGSSGIFD